MSLLYPILVACVGLPALFSLSSLLFLLLAAACGRRKMFHTVPASPLKLAVIVPAHDEELVLAGTLESLRAQDYPTAHFEILVVADNCTDQTAAIARERGVTVLERFHSTERGKGYALNHAVAHLLERPQPPDGIVIVDADTWTSPDFLSRLGGRLVSAQDLRGFGAWQGRYGVLNAGDGWRAALMAGAFDLVNHVKPLGREALGLSVGLKGNGMGFTWALAADLPWPGGSLTEDLDYGLELARRYNLRVRYAPEARVLAQMPASSEQAASQRARWEGGRLALVRQRALPLLAEGLRRRSLLLVDLAGDLLTPPLAELGALVAAFALLTAAGLAAHLLPHPAFWLAAALLCVVGLPVYVLGGLRLSGAPAEAYTALIRAPFYALWKFALLLSRAGSKRSRSGQDEWIRTARAPLSSETSPLPPSQVREAPPK